MSESASAPPAVNSSAARPHPRSLWPLRQRIIAEEPFFLVLAIFIGILSGLAVVCFRIAYLSTRIWLLSTSLSPAPSHLLLVPSLTGIVIALLVIYVFPYVR
ncbi:MAG: hypothetical protein ACM34G_01790, partial [Acidobacteriota bacterium]